MVEQTIEKKPGELGVKPSIILDVNETFSDMSPEAAVPRGRCTGTPGKAVVGDPAGDGFALPAAKDSNELLLVAVRPWDIHGASCAGLATTWVNRTGAPYPDHFQTLDHAVPALAEPGSVLAEGS